MIAISSALADARLAAVVGFMQTGSGSATANIYDGARPASGGVPAGNLLASIEFASPIGSVSAGVLTITPTAESLIAASGEGSWARILNANGDFAWDCNVSDQAGTGELKLASTTLYAGGSTRIVSGAIG